MMKVGRSCGVLFGPPRFGREKGKRRELMSFFSPLNCRGLAPSLFSALFTPENEHPFFLNPRYVPECYLSIAPQTH